VLKKAEQDFQLVAKVSSNRCFIDAQTTESTHVFQVLPPQAANRKAMTVSETVGGVNNVTQQQITLGHASTRIVIRMLVMSDGVFDSNRQTPRLYKRGREFWVRETDQISFRLFEIVIYIESDQGIRIVMNQDRYQ
jgi:hypothetical protein